MTRMLIAQRRASIVRLGAAVLAAAGAAAAAQTTPTAQTTQTAVTAEREVTAETKVTANAADIRTLDASRRSWQAANVGDYVYAYTKYCECHPETPPETYVTVRGGEVVDVRHKPFGFDRYVQAEARNFEWYWTVDQLFDLVASAIERGAEVRADYDTDLGYPTRIFIDRNPDLIGDEIDLELTRLEPEPDVDDGG